MIAQPSVLKKQLSLYIHIPFCKNICLYCNFLTFANKNKFIPEYIDALVREIKIKAKNFKDRRIVTIYFGGGTPSLIDAKYIEEILKTARENYNVADDVEISIECNPESIDAEKLEKYFHTGVTRVSLGIQNFDKKILHRIARPHDATTIFKALQAIQQSPIKNFGADFIIGLPHQTLENFQGQLARILEENIPHLSFYFLSYDTKRIDIFKADCPNDEIQISMYEHLISTLRDAGYIHYEVSNYAKPGHECQHNLRYWAQKEYLGLGLGAHSYLNKTCTENVREFEKYLQEPTLLHETVTIDSELHELEYIMLHLRTHQGINLQEYGEKSAEILKKAEPYIATKKLAHANNHLHATEQGFLILDKITHDLL